MIEQHEDIGWPAPEEELAMDKAQAAALATLRARTPQEIAELDAACVEAHRLREESRRRPAHAADGGGSV